MAMTSAASRVMKYRGESSPYTTKRSSNRQKWISILDEFSHSCFSPELTLYAIGTSYPNLDLDYVDPAIFFVESAWNGNAGKWRYQITSNSGPKEPFRNLVQAARKKGIPTVFWNKEDPVHFDEFKEAASLFDYVFTTDGDLVPRYQELLGHNNVKLLRFAAQPKIHNPRRVEGYQVGDIAFAGQYFRDKYPERRIQMETLFSAAQEHDFSIFSRMLGGNPAYQFPDDFAKHIVGSLPYSEMVDEYKRHKVFLNVNSVVNSSTMCARRIYELAACKTIVVSMHSDAIRSIFTEDEIPTVGNLNEAQECFRSLMTNTMLRYSTAQRAWRRVARSHTMEDRVQEIQETVGISRFKSSPSIKLRVIGDSITDSLLKDFEKQSAISELNASILIVDDQKEFRFGPDRPNCEVDYLGEVSSEYRYGKDYLLDMVLMLSKFVPEPIVTKSEWVAAGVPPEDDESRTLRLREGAWLARAAEIDPDEIVESAGIDKPIYLMDAHNLCRKSDSHKFSWEN